MQSKQEAVRRNRLAIDGHTHLAKAKKGDFAGSAANALEIMDKMGIGKTLVMPFPFSPGMRSVYEVDDYAFQQVMKKHPDRFTFLGGGGILNIMIQEAVRKGSLSENDKREFEQKALKIVESGAVGFGELAAEHLSLRSDHPYMHAPPDHPLFLLLADIAASHDMPIDIHMEAIPMDLPLLPGLKSPPNPKIIKTNIKALERLLIHNRKAKVIWAHAGWDNTGFRTIKLMRGMFERHPNLYMSLKINKRHEKERSKKSTFPLDSNRNVKQEWLDLLNDYSDRFYIGSDLKFGKPGKPRTAVMTFLNGLPQELAYKITYETPRRLFKIDGQ